MGPDVTLVLILSRCRRRASLLRGWRKRSCWVTSACVVADDRRHRDDAAPSSRWLWMNDGGWRRAFPLLQERKPEWRSGGYHSSVMHAGYTQTVGYPWTEVITQVVVATLLSLSLWTLMIIPDTEIDGCTGRGEAPGESFACVEKNGFDVDSGKISDRVGGVL